MFLLADEMPAISQEYQSHHKTKHQPQKREAPPLHLYPIIRDFSEDSLKLDHQHETQAGNLLSG